MNIQKLVHTDNGSLILNRTQLYLPEAIKSVFCNDTTDVIQFSVFTAELSSFPPECAFLNVQYGFFFITPHNANELRN